MPYTKAFAFQRGTAVVVVCNFQFLIIYSNWTVTGFALVEMRHLSRFHNVPSPCFLFIYLVPECSIYEIIQTVLLSPLVLHLFNFFYSILQFGAR